MADLTADQAKYAAALSDLNKTLVIAVNTGNQAAADALRQQIKGTMALYVAASTAAIAADGPGGFVTAVQHLDDAVGGAVSTLTTGTAGLLGVSVLDLVKPLLLPAAFLLGGVVLLVWAAGSSGAVRIRKAV